MQGILDTTRDMRLRLSDHKIELGQLGLEQTNRLQLYDLSRSSWIDLPWDAPVPIKFAGQALMIHYKDVNCLDGWEELFPYLTEAHRASGKGKHREV